jgi:Flp pilus assembly pilin Flp
VGTDGLVTFDTAYNQNEPAWEQLIEVYSQKKGDDLSAFWRMMNGNTSLPEWLKKSIGDATKAEIATQNAAQPFTDDEDLAQHLVGYRAALDSHAKLVLVSHSQGNFYANAAYAALEAENSEYGAATGVIGVASPASIVAGGSGPYTTFSEDWVINAVRFLYPNTLPANATIGTTEVDTLGHGFQTAYLTVPEARATIARNVVNVGSGLVPLSKPETGTDPACLPAVIEISDPADCASTLADSCVDRFFGSCFDPSGTCSMQSTGASTSDNLIALDSPTWSNGAQVSMVADITDPTAPTVSFSVMSSTGDTCATGVSRTTNDECAAEVVYQASGKSLSICAYADGTADVTCPDGTVIVLPTESLGVPIVRSIGTMWFINDRGSVTAEYAVLLGLVAVGCSLAVIGLGAPLVRMFMTQEVWLMLAIP